MTSKRIHIEKYLAALKGLPPNPKEAHIPGEAQNENFSLPLDYWIEGTLTEEMAVGKSVVVMREVRNGLDVTGLFQTTPVVELTDDTFTTMNSIYRYRFL
jgi:hypothetical protein